MTRTATAWSEYLGRTATRCGWRVYAFVIMPNHLHAVLKTPEPNLSRGMQHFLSGYANVWARSRYGSSGHVFQGRYRTELVEDETYLWTVTRYVHSTPSVRGWSINRRRGSWSSYPGYARGRPRLDWMAYDELLASWAGKNRRLGFGGCRPLTADMSLGDCRSHSSRLGFQTPTTAGFSAAKSSSIASSGWWPAVPLTPAPPETRRSIDSRTLAGRARPSVQSYGILAVRVELKTVKAANPARAAMAYLCGRYTTVTNGELNARSSAVSRAESVPNLTRRFDAWLSTDCASSQAVAVPLEDKLPGEIESEKT